MTDSYISSHVSLIFDGGLADGGELHFYEYSRCVYGYSRFLQTVEFYRREGIVAERIVGAANTDIIIKAPQQGSFIVDATVRAAEKVVPFLRRIPFDAVLSLVIDTVKDAPAESEVSSVLAKLAARANSDADSPGVGHDRSLEIAHGEPASAREALELADWAKRSSDPAIARAGISQHDLKELSLRAKADLRRQKQLRPYSDDFKKIPVSDLARLSSKVRPMISEMGLPLRKSADNLSLASGVRRSSIARLDHTDIQNINSRDIERGSVDVEASIKAYDKETGHGRLRLIEDSTVVSFSVPSHLRGALNRQITSGMNRKSVILVAQTVRDLSGKTTSFVVSGIDA